MAGYAEKMNDIGEALLTMADPTNQWRGYTQVSKSEYYYYFLVFM